MRLLIDTLIALMLAAILGAVVLDQRQDQEQLDRIAAVQQAVRAMQSQALYRAAMGSAEAMPNGYARRIDAAWFDQAPQNILVDREGAAYQWLDYPPEGGNQWFDPPHIVATGPYAAFWYNPYRGIVRARVPRQFTQEATVELYNLVNGTSLRVTDCRWDYRTPATKLVSSATDRAPTASSKPVLASTPADPILRDLTGGKKR